MVKFEGHYHLPLPLPRPRPPPSPSPSNRTQTQHSLSMPTHMQILYQVCRCPMPYIQCPKTAEAPRTHFISFKKDVKEPFFTNSFPCQRDSYTALPMKCPFYFRAFTISWQIMWKHICHITAHKAGDISPFSSTQ